MNSLLLLLTLQSYAQSLTYEQAIERALKQNPALASAQAELDSAQGLLLASHGGFDPILTADVGLLGSTDESSGEFGEVLSRFSSTAGGVALSKLFSTGTSISLDFSEERSTFRYELRDSGFIVESDDPLYQSVLTLNARQPLLEGHQKAYNLSAVRQASRGLQAAELGLRVERQTVVSTVASSWWSVWYQQRLLAIAEQSLAVAREEQRVVQAQVKLGALAPVESVRVEAAVVTAESNIIQARNALESAREGLLVLLGEAPSSPIELVLQAPPAERAASRPADQIIADALQGNPEMAQLRHAADGARQRLEEARHGRLPQLDLVGSAGLSGYETSLGSSLGEVASGDLKRWYIGAELAVPLGNRADRGSQQAREGEVAQAEQAVVAMERSLAQQIRAQVRIRESALASMRLAEANLKLAQETLAAERALLAAGRALQRDVLEAIRNLDNARVAVEKASMDFLLAEVELQRLQGAL